MIENKSIETFLSAVHDALGSMSISEKSDIIVELHALILDKVQQESKSIATAVKELGPPLEVAQKLTMNRYFYQELKGKKPFHVSVLRWITLSIGILGILAFLILGALIWEYSPIVKQTKEGISLFGGSINIKGNPKNFEGSLPAYGKQE